MTFREFKEKYQYTAVEEVSYSPPKKPVVSVLVQTYQHEEFIRECLDNILMQETNFEYEILIGEDGSVDGTREICLEYAKKYPDKIRLFLHHTANKIKVMEITTGNFNSLYNFYHARGKYIAFCEGDDYWQDPCKIQNQVDTLEKNPLFILSYHKFIETVRYYNQSKKSHTLIQPEQDLDRIDLSKLKFHPLLSTVCFRNCLKELPEEITKIINVDSFLLSMLGTLGMAKYQPEIKPSVYRKHSGGIWSYVLKEKKFLSKIITYKNLSLYYRDEKNIDLYKNFKAQLIYSYKMLIIFYLTKVRFLKAFKSFGSMMVELLRVKF